MVPPLCSQGQHLWKHPCCPNIWVIYPHLTLKISIIYTHTHKSILHTSTYYTCMHKNMSHPPQEGSNRSLAYCTLLGVLWQMCYAWIIYGMVRRTVQILGKFGGTCGKYQETCLFACFWDPYGSLAMLG